MMIAAKRFYALLFLTSGIDNFGGRAQDFMLGWMINWVGESGIWQRNLNFIFTEMVLS